MAAHVSNVESVAPSSSLQSLLVGHPFHPTLCMLLLAGAAGNLGPSARLVALSVPIPMPCQGIVPPAVCGSPTCVEAILLRHGQTHASIAASMQHELNKHWRYKVKLTSAKLHTLYQYLTHKYPQQGQPMHWQLPQHVDAEKLLSCQRLMHIPLATSTVMARALWGSYTALKEAQLIAHNPTCSASAISSF